MTGRGNGEKGLEADVGSLALMPMIDAWPEDGENEEDEASPPVVRALCEAVRPPDDDPSILLGRRWLCRGGLALLVGPTGIGKSALSLQMLMGWAVGREIFDIRPRRPLRALLVQAENDEGDLAEMRDGILKGLCLSSAEERLFQENVQYLTEDSRTGLSFFAMLDAVLQKRSTDILAVDPAFAYLGDNASEQAAVSMFLRNGFLPLLRKHDCAGLLVHHTNKPPTGKEKPDWRAGDFAYLRSGSAEWANAARAVLGIRSTGSHDVFQLIAGKRGKRLGWKDEEGNLKMARNIGHSDGHICWREIQTEEIEEIRMNSKKPEPSMPGPEAIVELLPAGLYPTAVQSFRTGKQLREYFRSKGWSRDRAEATRDDALAHGLIATVKGPRNTTYYGRPEVVQEYLESKKDDNKS